MPDYDLQPSYNPRAHTLRPEPPLQTLEEHQEEIAHLQKELAKYESGRMLTNDQRTAIVIAAIIGIVLAILIITIGLNYYHGQTHGSHIISKTETYSYNP